MQPSQYSNCSEENYSRMENSSCLFLFAFRSSSFKHVNIIHIHAIFSFPFSLKHETNFCKIKILKNIMIVLIRDNPKKNITSNAINELKI